MPFLQVFVKGSHTKQQYRHSDALLNMIILLYNQHISRRDGLYEVEDQA